MNEETTQIIRRDMTNEQSAKILLWREKGDEDDEGYGLSWRGIAFTFIKHYPYESQKWNILQTQPCGMVLCQIASEKTELKRYI